MQRCDLKLCIRIGGSFGRFLFGEVQEHRRKWEGDFFIVKSKLCFNQILHTAFVKEEHFYFSSLLSARPNCFQSFDGFDPVVLVSESIDDFSFACEPFLVVNKY